MWLLITNTGNQSESAGREYGVVRGKQVSGCVRDDEGNDGLWCEIPSSGELISSYLYFNIHSSIHQCI